MELAKGGDRAAMRVCLDRILPPRKHRPIPFVLPAITTVADLPTTTTGLLKAVAAGELTPSEAAEFGKLIDAHVRTLEAVEIEARLLKLEGKAT